MHENNVEKFGIGKSGVTDSRSNPISLQVLIGLGEPIIDPILRGSPMGNERCQGATDGSLMQIMSSIPGISSMIILMMMCYG